MSGVRPVTLPPDAAHAPPLIRMISYSESKPGGLFSSTSSSRLILIHSPTLLSQLYVVRPCETLVVAPSRASHRRRALPKPCAPAQAVRPRSR